MADPEPELSSQLPPAEAPAPAAAPTHVAAPPPPVAALFSDDQIEDAMQARVVWARVSGYPAWPVRLLHPPSVHILQGLTVICRGRFTSVAGSHDLHIVSLLRRCTTLHLLCVRLHLLCQLEAVIIP